MYRRGENPEILQGRGEGKETKGGESEVNILGKLHVNSKGKEYNSRLPVDPPMHVQGKYLVSSQKHLGLLVITGI